MTSPDRRLPVYETKDVVDFVVKRACGGPAMPDETPEQWGAGSRREQALSECVEDPATVADLAQAVLEASEGEARWP